MSFKEYVSVYKSVWGIIMASAVMGPFAMDAFTDLAPPWPQQLMGGIGTLTCVLTIVIGYLISSWIGLFKDKVSGQQRVSIQKTASFVCSLFLILSSISLLSYVNFYSLYVISFEQTVKEKPTVIRRVIGTQRLSNVDPELRDKEAIMYAPGFDVSDVWTAGSLRTTRLQLLTSFLGIFFFIALAVTVFATYMEFRKLSDSKSNTS